MESIKKKLADLHKTDVNVRKHSEKQIAEYIRSLNMFGQIRPLVVTDDGEILVGNGMFEAMSQMGWDECDTYVVSGMTRAQKTKLMLADNKVYELGATDFADFDNIIKGLGDFDVPGFDEDLLKMIADSAKEADDALGDYGRDPEPLPAPATRRPASDFGAPAPSGGGTSPYAPKSEQAPAGTPTVESGEERPFVICPKCGEKIWL